MPSTVQPEAGDLCNTEVTNVLSPFAVASMAMSFRPLDLVVDADSSLAGTSLARETANERLDSRQQVLLAYYRLSLSFQGGALLAIAVPSHLVDLTGSGDKMTVPALCAALSGVLIWRVRAVR